MWRILIAEFKYNKYWLAANYILFILFFVLYIALSITSLLEGRTWDIKPMHIPMMMVVTSIISTLIILTGKTAGKRDNFHMRLPVSARAIGAVRVLFAVFVWISLVILFWIPLILIKPDLLNRIAHLNLFYMNGIFLMFNAAWIIHIDFHKNIFTRHKILGFCDKELISVIFIAMIVITWFFLFSMPSGYVFGIFEPQRKAICGFFLSMPVITVLNLAGLAMTYLSVIVFVRRRTFLV